MEIFVSVIDLPTLDAISIGHARPKMTEPNMKRSKFVRIDPQNVIQIWENEIKYSPTIYKINKNCPLSCLCNLLGDRDCPLINIPLLLKSSLNFYLCLRHMHQVFMWYSLLRIFSYIGNIRISGWCNGMIYTVHVFTNTTIGEGKAAVIIWVSTLGLWSGGNSISRV